MSRLAWMAVGAAVVLGACAYPDFLFNGSGGAGGQAASTSSAGGSMPACTLIHPGGGTCEYLPGHECGCPASEKCGVSVESSGKTACGEVGSTANYDACGTNADCQDGSWCNHYTSVCEPICGSSADCAAGKCVPATQSGSTSTIPGLDICTAHCDPISAMPCSSAATCVQDPFEMDWDCFESGGAQTGDACTSGPDCTAGNICAEPQGTTTGTCTLLCTPPEDINIDQCFGGQCVAFDPALVDDGTDYGACQ